MAAAPIRRGRAGSEPGQDMALGSLAAFTEAQRAGCTEGKLLLQLLLGSLSKPSARQRRSDVLLAKASLSCASGSTSMGNS